MAEMLMQRSVSSLPTSLQVYDLSSGGVPSVNNLLGALSQAQNSSQRSAERPPGRSCLHDSLKGASPHPRPADVDDVPAPAQLARPAGIETSTLRSAQRAGARSPHIQAPMQAEDPLYDATHPEYLFTTGLFVARKPPYTVCEFFVQLLD